MVGDVRYEPASTYLGRHSRQLLGWQESIDITVLLFRVQHCARACTALLRVQCHLHTSKNSGTYLPEPSSILRVSTDDRVIPKRAASEENHGQNCRHCDSVRNGWCLVLIKGKHGFFFFHHRV